MVIDRDIVNVREGEERKRKPRRRSALYSLAAEEEQVMYERWGHRTHFDRRACRVRAWYIYTLYICVYADYSRGRCINIYVSAGRRTERGWESLINDIVLIGMDRVCFRDKWEMDSSAHNTRTIWSRPPHTAHAHTHTLSRTPKQKYGHFFSVQFSVRSLRLFLPHSFFFYNNARFY